MMPCVFSADTSSKFGVGRGGWGGGAHGPFRNQLLLQMRYHPILKGAPVHEALTISGAGEVQMYAAAMTNFTVASRLAPSFHHILIINQVQVVWVFLILNHDL